MTAAQLAHLAELAAFAADFFAATDPSASRKFGDAALRADALSVEFRRAEERAHQGVERGGGCRASRSVERQLL
jgi:hypothetical protein